MEPRLPGDPPAAEPPLKGLFAEMGRLISSLLRDELDLAKAEAVEKGLQVAKGAAAVFVGALIGLAGLIVVLEAFVAAMRDLAGISPAWGALIGALVIAVLAAILVVAGVRRLRPSGLVPSRTIESYRRTRQMFVRLCR